MKFVVGGTECTVPSVFNKTLFCVLFVKFHHVAFYLGTKRNHRVPDEVYKANTLIIINGTTNTNYVFHSWCCQINF
jgi:hypothetical protein